ncbi:MAG: FAD binding domain-containing protein [Geminicoccaceae bacterium]
MCASPAYLRPARLSEALAALADGSRLVLAGGTDVYPARVGRPLAEPVLDVTALPELAGIAEDEAGWRIGAATRWSTLASAPEHPLFAALRAAAREVGGRQIQNAGTIGGNLCNASPAADGAPCLLAMEASVELASTRGVRTLPLADFLLGNRRTARAADELLVAVRIPRPGGTARSAFLKLGARRYLVISIAMVAVVVVLGTDGRIASARVAVGACAPVAIRLAELEVDLAGRPLDPTLPAVVLARHIEPLQPLDDIRATAAYRRDAALTLVRRTLEALSGP